MLSKKQFGILAVLVILSGFAGGILSGLIFKTGILEAQNKPRLYGEMSSTVPVIELWQTTSSGSKEPTGKMKAIPVVMINNPYWNMHSEDEK